MQCVNQITYRTPTKMEYNKKKKKRRKIRAARIADMHFLGDDHLNEHRCVNHLSELLSESNVEPGCAERCAGFVWRV